MYNVSQKQIKRGLNGIQIYEAQNNIIFNNLTMEIQVVSIYQSQYLF